MNGSETAASGATFSDELIADMFAALGSYLDERNAESRERLRQVTDRMCREAHALSMSAEQMVIAIKALFARARPGWSVSDPVHDVFDMFLAGCIKAYYGGSAP
jgi:hypothetical protein